MHFFKFTAYICTTIILLSCTPIDEQKGIITIHNASPDTVSDVTVSYTNAARQDVIGTLAPDQRVDYTIHYSDNEDSIYVSYRDEDQVTHSIDAVPYAAKYDKQHYTVTIQ